MGRVKSNIEAEQKILFIGLQEVIPVSKSHHTNMIMSRFWAVMLILTLRRLQIVNVTVYRL